VAAQEPLRAHGRRPPTRRQAQGVTHRQMRPFVCSLLLMARLIQQWTNPCHFVLEVMAVMRQRAAARLASPLL
jgi:hypothetical protein